MSQHTVPSLRGFSQRHLLFSSIVGLVGFVSILLVFGFERSSVAKGRSDFVRGLTISCFGWGPEWGTAQMQKTLRDIQSLGATGFSFHPYAFLREDGSLHFPRGGALPYVRLPIRWGRSLGLKVMVIPHIGYWRTRFAWRGAIRFESEAEWKRFFSDYTAWITSVARIAQEEKADIFSVGLEYHQTYHREADWRKVIAEIRKVFRGTLTYGANWDSYQKVPFWDALDIVGIQAYFPLTAAPSPTDAQILEGWDRVFAGLRVWQKKQGKKILFTELGYNHKRTTLAHPWEEEDDSDPASLAIKTRAIRLALGRIEKETFLQGVFLWKWFPTDQEIASNFTLQYPALRQILRALWLPPSPLPPKPSPRL